VCIAAAHQCYNIVEPLVKAHFDPHRDQRPTSSVAPTFPTIGPAPPLEALLDRSLIEYVQPPHAGPDKSDPYAHIRRMLAESRYVPR
jgi:hypothetical protein